MRRCPLIQGKEQQLHFAGAAMKRCPTSRGRDTPRPREEIPHTQEKRNPSKVVGVARRHQKADTLRP